MATEIEGIKVAFTEHYHDLPNLWMPFSRDSRILPKGWTKNPGRRSLPVDIILDKDVPVKLRDGTVLYADVFRPAGHGEKPVPALLPWSPYGKTGSGIMSLDAFPFRVGIPRDATSGLEKFEAPDPAEWCSRGYAVVNVDARGTWHSEGDFYVYGTQVCCS